MEKFIKYYIKPVAEVRELQQNQAKQVASSCFINCPDEDNVARGIAKGVGATAIGITTILNPPLGATIGTATGVGGKLMEEVGKDSDDKELQKAGNVVSTSSVGSAIGGGVEKVGTALADKALERTSEEALKEIVEEAIKNA